MGHESEKAINRTCWLCLILVVETENGQEQGAYCWGKWVYREEDGEGKLSRGPSDVRVAAAGGGGAGYRQAAAAAVFQGAGSPTHRRLFLRSSEPGQCRQTSGRRHLHHVRRPFS